MERQINAALLIFPEEGGVTAQVFKTCTLEGADARPLHLTIRLT